MMDFSSLDSITFEGNQEQATSKNKVDIVFVIDNSGSMYSVIEGVINHVTDFTDMLANDTENPIDYRIGFVLHGDKNIVVRNFTDDAYAFQEALRNSGRGLHDTGFDEFSLPALDVAADFDWQKKRHKFIIFFTDEDVSGGYLPEMQLSKYAELLSKIEALKIKLYYFGPDTAAYRELQRIPGTEYYPTETFDNLDFSKILSSIAKSVSVSSTSPLDGTQKEGVKKNIYGVENYVTIKQTRNLL